ncbi:hypothetical protein ACLBYD_26590 [Rhodococcus sp. C26F]
MARQPSVFIRSLIMEEGRRLQKISRTTEDPIKFRRAIVVLMSAQGQTAQDITSLTQVNDDYVRDVIHACNSHGFEALHQNGEGDGRSRSMSRRVSGSA